MFDTLAEYPVTLLLAARNFFGSLQIILDAFSSDALPVHLIKREAVAPYLAKLAEGGLMVFNITDNYMDLGVVFRNLARDSNLFGLARSHGYHCLPEGRAQLGILPSYRVVLAPRREQLRCLSASSNWTVVDLIASPDAATRPRTDDFSNIAQCLIMFRSDDSFRTSDRGR